MLQVRTAVLLLTSPFLAPQAPELISAELQPQTLAGFTRYVQATEARIDKEIARQGAFLYVRGLPDHRRSQIQDLLKRGEIFMEQFKTRDSAGQEIKVPDGLVHHWFSAVFVPRASLRQALDLAQNYDRHKDVYKPEVIASRLVSRDGNNFKIFYRLRKKKFITVTLDTDHDVLYFPLDPSRCHSRSFTTRIQEIDNAGEPDERSKPVGHDSGFLWRLNSYWRFEERDGGLYVECESVSLTRDIPWVASFIIKPFVTDIPKESLQMTMGSMRSALLQNFPAQAGK